MSRLARVFTVLASILVCGCWETSKLPLDAPDSEDVDADSDTDSDSDSDADSDADTGSDTDSVPNTDAGCVGDLVWFESETGLCWEREPPDATNFSWSDAQSYCATTGVGGYEDWRLPEVQELMSLLSGCDQSECEVSDPDCLEPSCGDECMSSAPGDGPAEGGCYVVTTLGFICVPVWFWSGSGVQGEPGEVWYVRFWDCSVGHAPDSEDGDVRCVRDP